MRLRGANDRKERQRLWIPGHEQHARESPLFMLFSFSLRARTPRFSPRIAREEKGEKTAQRLAQYLNAGNRRER